VVEILQITPGDIQLFRDLLSVFGKAFSEMDTFSQKPPSDEYLAHLLRSDYFIALAAVEQHEVVGGLAAYELKKFEQERSEMYIYDLAVSEHRRRQGIATQLISELQQIAAKRGAYVLFVQADLGDAPAIALYSKLGIREDVLHFDISVPKQKPNVL